MSYAKGELPVRFDCSREPSRVGCGRIIWLSLFLAAASIVDAHLGAQVTSGTIFDTVQDPTGALIPNASITATDPSKGVTRTGTASSSGTFSLPNLPPGTYTVQVTYPGFETFSKSGVILNAADNLNAGIFTLKIGSTASSVTVT